MTTKPHQRATRHAGRAALLAVVAALLAACGGGGDSRGDQPGAAASCSATDRKQWLRDYFQGSSSLLPQYFWYRLSPNPSPAAYASAAAYFPALTYTGADAEFPAADRWSSFESTESFNRFFGAGQTQGYGVSVAGLEVQDTPGAPLYVRMVDPGSPAATTNGTGGLRIARGDRVVSIGPYSSAQIIQQVRDGSFTILSPDQAGTSVSMVLEKPNLTQYAVTLNSAIYALTPVSGARVVTQSSGRRIGYLFVRNMVDQAITPMANAFASFRSQAIHDLVLDLRYNGGGFIDVGQLLASYVGGERDRDRVYVDLLFNQDNQHKNSRLTFQPQAQSLDMGRVYVLAGERTCSAAEQVISALQGVGMQVTVIGDATCGKPVGFVPQADGCGTTYSVVNFESRNHAGVGRYFNGLAADCPVAENFQAEPGSNTDPLFSAARLMADGSACAVAGGGLVTAQSQRAAVVKPRARPGNDGERSDMRMR